MALKYNNISNNILVSFEYMRSSNSLSDLCFQAHQDGLINLMIDSGAFSVFKKPHAKLLTVDDYSAFLKANHETCNKYVMLDVIGNQKKTEFNYKEMINKGLNPMYVLTMANNEFNMVMEAVKNQPYICVAGGFDTKSNWIKKRFQDTFNLTNGEAKIHGLAYVFFKDMLRLPLQSVDSSSWLSGARYGTISYFKNGEGIKKTTKNDILSGKKKVDIDLKILFKKHQIKPIHLTSSIYTSGSRSVMNYLDIIANIEYQEYCKKHGLDYFLAGATTSAISWYLKTLQSIKQNLTYEQWRDL